MTGPHEETSMIDMGGRCQNTQETVHWKSQASARVQHCCMGHSGQVQFQAGQQGSKSGCRIIAGAMKSTPNQELKNITGLQSLEDRRDTKLLTQAAKYKRLPGHPIKERLSQPTKGRLQRGSFNLFTRAGYLNANTRTFLTTTTKRYSSVLLSLPGQRELFQFHQMHHPCYWPQRLLKWS